MKVQLRFGASARLLLVDGSRHRRMGGLDQRLIVLVSDGRCWKKLERIADLQSVFSCYDAGRVVGHAHGRLELVLRYQRREVGVFSFCR